MVTRTKAGGVGEYVYELKMHAAELRQLLEIAESQNNKKTVVATLHIDNSYTRPCPKCGKTKHFSDYGLRYMGKGMFEVRDQPRCSACR